MIRSISLILLSALAPCGLAQSPTALTGHWLMTGDNHGTTFYMPLDLVEKGSQLTGKIGGDALHGEVHAQSVHFTARDEDNNTGEVNATLADGKLTGTLLSTDAHNPAHSDRLTFVAVLSPRVTSGTPKRHEFVPTVFYRDYSPLHPVVLTVNPGDTIHTTTVDAGGNDEHGDKRVAGGNPQTGPFYVNGAEPGDTLVVRIVHLKLNRDWAESDDNLDPRALSADLAVRMKDNHNNIKWHLDLAKGTASPDKPGEHMRTFAIPVSPMLGCVATAVGPGGSAPRTQDSGSFGGNMDFNGVTDGATLYLPVSVPGALLYVGDGHALQGDGELNGNALETSMDVEVTVDLIRGKRIHNRIETPTEIIAMGLDGSIDDAFRDATSNMAGWIMDQYKLTPSETSQFLGVAADYHVSEVADRNAGVVLKIAKSKLSTLAAPKAMSGEDPSVPQISR
ncbi:acetamidase/formamidase family protein [Terriglobus aquaticus]|uniref:Acetamidase/formamidase family protein n=1 Tax=Terriglobus aquaticus TaxID=940139 RepID=A0ABW9KH95_9BACT|nr:acetamidase/formamidase family protein [Terriglobus aquaticus]